MRTLTESPNRLSNLSATRSRNGKAPHQNSSESDLVWLDLNALAKLQVHPLLKHIPEKGDQDDDFASLIESVNTQGFLTPAIIDDSGHLLCGRHRRRVAVHLGRELPCRRVSGDRAAEVILNELCVARHLPKGALAYLSIPLLQPVLEAAVDRKISNLDRSPKRNPDTHLGKEGDSITFGAVMGPCATIADLAKLFGFSKDTLNQARRLRELLVELTKSQRAEIEAKLMSGELGLGYAITAATNYKRNKEAPSDLGKRQEHDRLFVNSFKKTLLHWGEADAAQRQQISKELRKVALDAPDDLRAELRRVFK